MKPVLFLAVAVLALGLGAIACTREGTAQERQAESSAAPTGAAGSSAAATAAGTARTVSENSDLYAFDYAYPAAAAAIPDLKAWLDQDLVARKSKLVEDATAWQAEAKNDGVPYHAYAHATKWQVVTELPGWLSLSAQRYEFTGGAHGMPWSDGLIWDKAGNRRREALDLFVSPAALSAAIRRPFCAELDRQREEKRGEPVKRGTSYGFDECIDPVKSQIILGSGDRQHFTRLGVLVDPYEAGPYAEGNYEVTLPVTAALVKAVKPEYRGAFAPAR
ncbi:uncharacterized protein DUF4163 [Novosphingobium kunmingense]|uniref:Uncharacterized protein DUF4163 n=1 Tax=Novosphingobium kunmingense TaxID=1211806 RepID=A0A2N0HKV9_9SPHN|nr:DUF3298 and DUF4163 domain-containing protein [Novosphingobium kunmingense]PKB19549.1 uncharacterized protein DUF4163 [Novosphingobium kunmingense]